MRSNGKWIAAVVALGVFGAAAAPWTFSGTALRQEIARQIREATGLRAESDGRAVLALLPRPRIKIENLRIRDRDGSLDIAADFLRGNLRILPMFAGRLELESIVLANPNLTIDIDVNPFTEQGAIARAMDPAAADAARPAAAGNTERLGIVTLTNGSAVLKSRARAIEVAVEQIDLTIDWRSLGSPAGVKGSFRLNGDTAEVAAWLGKPGDLLRGKASDISMRLVSPTLNASLNGVLIGGPLLQYDGNLSVASPSLRRLASGYEPVLPAPGRLEAFSLTGNARIRSNSIAVSEARISMDGNAYEGALAIDGDRPRPMLSGTLAADVINLAPLFADAPELVGPGGRWTRARMPGTNLAPMDVDVRLSASRARLGRTQLRDVGVSLLLKPDQAEISLAEAKAFNGFLKGRVTVRRNGAGYDLRAGATFSHLDSAALVSEAFRNQRVSGELSGEIALASTGQTVGQFLRSLAGVVRMSLKSGDLAGLDLEQALRRLEKRPLAIASEVRNGRTNFETADVDLQIDAGIATIRKAEARGPGVEFGVSGVLDIPERVLDLSLQARQSGAARESGPTLSMDLKGGWDDPVLLLDARSLINRSEAAAPLLRAPAESAPAPR